MTDENEKNNFELKYPNSKVNSFPTVFLTQVINDKITEIVEVGHANNTEAFIKLINDAYLKLPKIGGYKNNNNDEYYKLKYLKYKAKYLQYKS